MCSPDNLMIFLKSWKFDNSDLKVEEWYQTKYSVEAIPEDLVTLILNPVGDESVKKLDLPPANTFIPQNFDLISTYEKYSSKPQLLKTWPDAHLWYKFNGRFLTPKAVVNLKIYTSDNGIGIIPEKRLFVHVWLGVVEACLRELRFAAGTAGLNFDISPMHDNLNMAWMGYSDSLQEFVVQSMAKIIEINKALQ